MDIYNNIDLNLYKVFLVVSETGSISKAAEKLYVSQPAVSHAIKTLEKSLKLQLFYRDAKGVRLTPEANQLLFYIKSAYNSIYTAHRIISESEDLITGIIRIGVPSHIGVFLLAEYIEKFNKLYPGIKFSIISRSTVDMVEMLETRNLDLIVDSYPIIGSRTEIETYNLTEIENCFVANRSYKELAEKEYVTLEELKSQKLLLPVVTTSTRTALEDALSDYSKKSFETLVEVYTTEMMIELVKRGIGVGYCAKSAVETLVQKGELDYIKIREQLPRTQICLAFVSEYLTNAPKKFVEVLREEIIV